MRSPFYTLHTPIVQSQDAEAKYSPLGENTKLLTLLECYSIFILSPLDTLHTPIVMSLDPDAKKSPSGENTTLLT